MSFAIITDSTSDISPAHAQELGIYVIPLHVIIEGEDLLDQVQITAEEYVARMAGSEQLPHTSQPSAGEFKALFDRVLADGHDSAIFISLCSEWSACYANASLTAETHELDVRCIDSRTGSGAEGLLVEYALAMREDGRSLDETEAQIRATLPDAEIIPISAREGFNIAGLFDRILALLPEGEPFYPKDTLTDKTLRFFASEIIREKILRNYDKEIPYSCEIEIEEYREEPGIDRISAVIYVARNSQKGILIGHKGEKLKKVGRQAREELEEFLRKKVFLQLFVKVSEDWRNDQRQLRRFGYDPQ